MNSTQRSIDEVVKSQEGRFVRTIEGVEESLLEQERKKLAQERKENMRLQLCVKEKGKAIRDFSAKLEKELEKYANRAKMLEGDLEKERARNKKLLDFTEQQEDDFKGVNKSMAEMQKVLEEEESKFLELRALNSKEKKELVFQIADLKKKVEPAEAYIDQLKEHAKNSKSAHVKYREESKNIAGALRAETEEYKEKMSVSQKTISDLEQELAKQKGKCVQEHKKFVRRGSEIVDLKNVYEETIEDLRESLDHERHQGETLKKDGRRKEDAIVCEAKRFEEEIEKTSSTLGRTKKKLMVKEKELAAFKKQYSSAGKVYEKTVSELRAELEYGCSKNTELKAVSEKREKYLLKQINGFEDEVSSLSAVLEEAREDLSVQGKQMEVLNKKNSSVRKVNEDRIKELSEVVKHEQLRNQELMDEIEGKDEVLQTETGRLEVEIASSELVLKGVEKELESKGAEVVELKNKNSMMQKEKKQCGRDAKKAQKLISKKVSGLMDELSVTKDFLDEERSVSLWQREEVARLTKKLSEAHELFRVQEDDLVAVREQRKELQKQVDAYVADLAHQKSLNNDEVKRNKTIVEQTTALQDLVRKEQAQNRHLQHELKENVLNQKVKKAEYGCKIMEGMLEEKEAELQDLKTEHKEKEVLAKRAFSEKMLSASKENELIASQILSLTELKDALLSKYKSSVREGRKTRNAMESELLELGNKFEDLTDLNNELSQLYNEEKTSFISKEVELLQELADRAAEQEGFVSAVKNKEEEILAKEDLLGIEKENSARLKQELDKRCALVKELNNRNVALEGDIDSLRELMELYEKDCSQEKKNLMKVEREWFDLKREHRNVASALWQKGESLSLLEGRLNVSHETQGGGEVKSRELQKAS